nr:hypothetical protein [Cohnella sp. WQ 127256]
MQNDDAYSSVQSALGQGTRNTVGVNGQNLQSMDIETALMMVQSERTKLLDAQLKSQIESVQNRNTVIMDLNATLSKMQQLLAMFPSQAASSTKLPGSANGVANEIKLLLEKSKVTLVYSTKGEVEDAMQKLKSMIDAQSNSQQMDMLRLQSMSNKRNEAFDVMTNFIKKMQESRSSIIGNMR